MRLESEQTLLAWDVVVPGKQQSYSAWDRRPRGTLLIGPEDGHQEHVLLPKQVARILQSKKKSDEIHPASRNELLYIVRELEHACARTRIQRLIDRREYSSVEIRQKLQQDGYSEQTIDACLDRAREVGLVSDRRFADNFIHSKVASGWGMERISRELTRYGIETKDLPGWPYEYLDPEDEVERALNVAQRKRIEGSRAYEKLVRHLCGKGYSTGVATRAARMALDQERLGNLVDI